jgi:hypothetical protein
MEEPYIEGVATHDGHEPCVGVREDVGEALVVARAGWAIEPRNRVCSGCRRCHDGRKATSPVALARVAGGPRVVGEPVHVRNLHVREPGDPTVARPQGGQRGECHACC